MERKEEADIIKLPGKSPEDRFKLLRLEFVDEGRDTGINVLKANILEVLLDLGLC